MSQQRGEKRARKVMQRKQRLAREQRKSNIKQAIYAFEKALKEHEGEHKHDHSDHEGHDHD